MVWLRFLNTVWLFFIKISPLDELISEFIKEKVQKEFSTIYVNLKDNIGFFRAAVIKSKMDRYIKKVHHRINYRELLPFFPGFQSKDFIRSGILLDHF